MKLLRKVTPSFWHVSGILALALLSGCSLPRAGCSHIPIGDEMMARTSHTVMCVGPAEFAIPPDVIFEDGVSEDEAVATALSNNAAFQSMLTQLGMAEGDLIQAGLLTNPNLGTFLPISAKQWEWTLFLPLEAFVLRPHRLAIADSDYERVANELVQNGLTLVRDVRVAHADLALAIAQFQLAQEIINIRQGISDLTQKRLDRGDISELEAMTARVDVLNAEANAGLLEQNVVVARGRLAWLMGMPPNEEPLNATLDSPPPLPELDVSWLIDEAFAMRPDARAADWAVAAAAERLRVARWAFLRIDGVADANARGIKGYEAGPGVRFDIPIFNRNQGGVMRAEAELRQAQHNRDAIWNQIVQDVRMATAQWTQAKNNLMIVETKVAPALHEARQIAEKGFAAGGSDYLLVLQTTSQYVDARVRILDQVAALQRARAELERSVGRQLIEGLTPHDPQESVPPGVRVDGIEHE